MVDSLGTLQSTAQVSVHQQPSGNPSACTVSNSEGLWHSNISILHACSNCRVIQGMLTCFFSSQAMPLGRPTSSGDRISSHCFVRKSILWQQELPIVLTSMTPQKVRSVQDERAVQSISPHIRSSHNVRRMKLHGSCLLGNVGAQ